MASKGTRGTAIAFGEFLIEAKLVKAKRSRDVKTEYVNAADQKVTMSGAGGGSRTVAPGVEKAVRLSPSHVIRLPQVELDAIEKASKDAFEDMQVLEAIDYRQVPTERIEGSYWLQPSQGSAQGLYLLHRALHDRDKVLVVKWCSSSREKLGVIRPRWIRGAGEQQRALLLSEVTFANDFALPDEDVLSINEAARMLYERDPAAHARAVEAAERLIDAFARERGDEKAIETASDSAVDARLALLSRLSEERFGAELEASVEAIGAGADTGGELVTLDEHRTAA